jgi:hypothetical protein
MIPSASAIRSGRRTRGSARLSASCTTNAATASPAPARPAPKAPWPAQRPSARKAPSTRSRTWRAADRGRAWSASRTRVVRPAARASSRKEAQGEDERNREKRPAQQAGPKLCGRSEVSHGTLPGRSGEAGALRDSPGILAGRCRPRNAQTRTMRGSGAKSRDQEFHIAFRAGDRAFHDPSTSQPSPSSQARPRHSARVQRRIAHRRPCPLRPAASNCGLIRATSRVGARPAPAAPPAPCAAMEAGVAHHPVRRPADMRRREHAGAGLFQHGDARVLPQLPRQLVGARSTAKT